MPFEDGAPVRGVAAREPFRAHVREYAAERLDLVGAKFRGRLGFPGGFGHAIVGQGEKNLGGHACLAIAGSLADNARKPFNSQELRCVDG